MNDNEKNELKNEALEAVSQVKDVIKNIDFKEETEETKGFFTEMLSNTIGKMRSVANSGSSLITIAIIILATWTAAVFIRSVLSTLMRNWRFADVIPRLVNVVTSTLSPAFIVLILAVAVYIFYKGKVKQFMPILITMTIASAPRALGAVLSIFVTLIPTSNMVIASVNAFLYLISIILVYFGIKALVAEDNDESFFKNFIKIQCVYFVARIVLGAFSISI